LACDFKERNSLIFYYYYWQAKKIMNMKTLYHQSQGNSSLPRHYWVSLILFGALVLGCAGAARQPKPEELMAQVQAQAQKSTLQDQLLAQVGRATLSAYQDYAVGPEDLLIVSFLGVDSLNRDARVNGRGEISLPLVGVVQVAGLSPQEIEKRLVKLYKEGEFINEPQISVQVKEYRHQRVMVTGAVARPGAHEVIGPRTLLEMLGTAGGLKENAGEVVHVIRSQSAPDLHKALKAAPAQSFSPGTKTIVIDLKRLLTQGALELNLPIKNGDVIHVPFAKSAYVLGAVTKPGNVFIKDNVTVTQAVAMAGGLHPMLASNKITVLRLDEKGATSAIRLDVGQVTAGKEADIPLKENDIVFVQESTLRRFLYDFRNLMPGSFGVGASVVP
jgi:polysaccharide export outer membrane protein